MMRRDVSTREALDCLDAYVQRHSWIGYDPYDLKADPRFARLLRSPLSRPPALASAMLFPGTLRKVLGVKPLPHPKAMALFALAYLSLFESSASDGYRDLAIGRLQWLVDNAASGYSGYAWGIPFDYQGRDRVDRGTPTTVITAIAIDAFLNAHRLLGDPAYLDVAASASNFLVEDIPRTETTPGRLCFSKSPGLGWHIHNANLMTAAALVKTGLLLDRSDWIELARKAVNYSLAEQQPDGSWYYWGPPDQVQPWIDHYHTGFVLRALEEISSAAGWEDLQEPLQRGYTYYIERMFDAGRIPRFTDWRTYPVDIHSCAEAILCLGQLSSRFPLAYDMMQSVAQWTLENMRHSSGYFYYRRYPGLAVKIPYMRWGQAWMLLALARLLSLTRENIQRK